MRGQLNPWDGIIPHRSRPNGEIVAVIGPIDSRTFHWYICVDDVVLDGYAKTEEEAKKDADATLRSLGYGLTSC